MYRIMYRTLAHLILILTLIHLPVLVLVVVCACFCFFFSKPFEVLLYAILLDSVFYSAHATFVGIPLYTATATLLFALIESIKPYLRRSYIV